VENAAGSNADISASSSKTEDEKATKKRAASKRQAAKKTGWVIQSDHCDADISSDCSMAWMKSRPPVPPSHDRAHREKFPNPSQHKLSPIVMIATAIAHLHQAMIT